MYSLYDSEIQDMDVCTSSDHKAVTAKMDLGHLIRPYSAAEIRREKHERTVFLYNEAESEHWEKYRQELERMLEKKISIQDFQRFSTTREEAESVDRIDL